MSDLPLTTIAQSIPDISVDWLRGRRWFSSKGRTVASISVAEWGRLPLDRPGVIAFARVRYTAGRDEQYLLPLIATPESQSEGVQTPPALALPHDGTTWYVHDAFQFVDFQRLLMQLMIEGSDLALQSGRVIFRPEAALRESPPLLEQIKLVTAEQSNTSIIYDRRAILKCFRRVVAGINPDVEVARFLTTRAGFTHTPAMLGSIAYVSAKGVEHSLGLLQEFVPNEGDAWERTLAQLNRFLVSAQESGTTPDQEATMQRLAADQLAEIQHLGTLTGEMHRALASDPADPDFAPRPLNQQQVAAWQHAIRQQRDAILADLEQRAPDLPEQQREAVAKLLAARPRIEQRIEQLSALADANIVTTRFHGDYHLGQVLASDCGFLILDFEGEPLRSLEERRAHSSPLKDVAGMLRSLSYAAEAGLRQSDADPTELRPWAGAWEQAAREAFLDGYLSVARDAAFVPRQPELLHQALSAFELEKALYELNYELNNRPDWLPIPLEGIQRVI